MQLTLVIFIGVASVGVACWVRARKYDWLKPFFCDESVPARWGFIDLLIIFGMWKTSQIMVVFIASLVLGVPIERLSAVDAEMQMRISWISYLVQLCVVFGSLFYLVLRYQHSWRDFWYSTANHAMRPFYELRVASVAFAMWAPLVWLIQVLLTTFWTYQHPTIEALRENPNAPVLILTWVSAVICAPIIEEVIYRGVLQGWLQRLGVRPRQTSGSLIYGDHLFETRPEQSLRSRPFQVLPIVLTSGLFAAAHIGQGPAPIPLFVFSVGLGFLYQRTGSLLACIVMHMLLNLVGMTISTFEILS